MIGFIIILGLFFVVLGRIITTSNAKHLLSGYNTLSEAEQAEVDLEGYIMYFRKFHWVLGISFIALSLLMHIWGNSTMAGLFIATYPLVAYIFMFIKTQQFFDEHSKISKSNRLGITILSVSLILVSALILLGSKKNKVEMEGKVISISGVYGEDIHMDEIESISIMEEAPKTQNKLSGYAMGNIKKGLFTSTSGEKMKLILNHPNDEVIKIQRIDDIDMYLSLEMFRQSNIFKQIGHLVDSVDR